MHQEETLYLDDLKNQWWHETLSMLYPIYKKRSEWDGDKGYMQYSWF